MNSKLITSIFLIVIMSLTGCNSFDSADNQPANTVANSDESQSAGEIVDNDDNSSTDVVVGNDESQPTNVIEDNDESRPTNIIENNDESQPTDVFAENDDHSSADAIVNNYNNQPNNIVSLGFSLLHDGKIYFSDNTGIYAMGKDGSNKQKISAISARNLCIHDNTLFFKNISDQFWLCSMNLDGSNMRNLVETHVGEFQIINSKIYFTDFSKNLSIYSYDLASKEIKWIADKEAEYLLAIRNYLYYVSYTGGGVIERFNTVNDNIESVYKHTVGPIGANNLQLFALYDALYRVENQNLIKIHDAQIYSLNIYNDNIYYVDRTDELIYKIAVDGTGLVQVSDEKFNFINILEKNMLIARKSFNDDSLYMIQMDGDKTVSTTRIN